MREIKFRAWDKKAKRIYPSDIIAVAPPNSKFSEWSISGDGITIRADSENFELMQYTGLKDKKRTEEYPEGQEMYEEDIIETYVRNSGGLDNVRIKVRAVIMFKFSRWYGDIRWSEQDRGAAEIELLSYKMDAIEIIGNECENPELLDA